MPMKMISQISANAAKPLTVRSKAGSKKAEIIIYDQIGQDWFGEGVTAKAFSDELKKLDSSVKEIVVRINSPGGDVFQGVTIYNRLRDFKKTNNATITVHIDGLAASIASIIALAGDEIVMGEGSLYMIHLPWTMAMGNRKDIESTLNRLADVEDLLVNIYAKKTGLDKNEIKTMLEEETWMSAERAIELGFVDKKDEAEALIAASAMGKTWIHRAPKKFNSQAKVVSREVTDLKNKIAETLARK